MLSRTVRCSHEVLHGVGRAAIDHYPRFKSGEGGRLSALARMAGDRDASPACQPDGCELAARSLVTIPNTRRPFRFRVMLSTPMMMPFPSQGPTSAVAPGDSSESRRSFRRGGLPPLEPRRGRHRRSPLLAPPCQEIEESKQQEPRTVRHEPARDVSGGGRRDLGVTLRVVKRRHWPALGDTSHPF